MRVSRPGPGAGHSLVLPGVQPVNAHEIAASAKVKPDLTAVRSPSKLRLGAGSGAGQDIDVGGAHRLAALRAGQLGMADLTAGEMPVQAGCAAPPPQPV